MFLVKNGECYGARACSGCVSCGSSIDILINGDTIVEIGSDISETDDMTVIDASGLVVAPGLVDIHVHFREPGFEYKENIQTGADAAAAGGVTTCCCMANTSPVIDSKEYTEYITKKAKQVPITVLPIGAVTFGLQGNELTDFNTLRNAGAVALSDDGIPIINDDIMRKALQLAALHNLTIISHCEEEASMVVRDIKLAAVTNTKVHIAHVSTAAAVEAIRLAKANGIKVTAETCPHYFSLTSEKVAEKGTLAKMSPPLRSENDVKAIIEGLCDGTIDAIATDHAPHSDEEKSLLFCQAPNGIIGLETLLAVSLTYLYHTGKMPLNKVIELMSSRPAEVLNLNAGRLKTGGSADIVIFDPDEEWTIDSSMFKSKARNTPYGGMKLQGKVKYTISKGKVVYYNGELCLPEYK